MIGRLSTAGGIAAGICLNLLVALILGEVVARNLFGVSLRVTLDLGGWLFVSLCFLSFAWVLKTGDHIRLTFVVERLPAPWRRRIALAVGIVSTAFAVFLAVSVYRQLAFAHRTGIGGVNAPDLPIWTVWAVVFAGSVLLVLQSARGVVDAARRPDRG